MVNNNINNGVGQNMNNLHFFYSLNNNNVSGISKQRNKSIEKSVILDESQDPFGKKNQSSNEETKRKFKYIRPKK
jgi:hypothetical protein